MRRFRRVLWTLVALVALSLAALPFVFPYLLYVGWSTGGQGGYGPLAGATRVALGERSGFYWPAEPGKPTLVGAHGNGGRATWFSHGFGAVVADGYGLLVPEYAGYDGEAGRPSQARLTQDFQAALTWLAEEQGVAVEDTVLVGTSLGSAVVMQLVEDKPWHALILLAPMTSLRDVARARAPYLPARWATWRNAWRSDLEIGQIQAPLLMVLALDDTVIPNAMSRELFSLAPEPKRLEVLENAGHSSLFRHGAGARISAFLAELD